MRTARLVGPTADGTSVVLVTEDGEELRVAVDDAVRSTWPGSTTTPPPSSTTGRRSPRRRETDVETPLSPRDIQTRIRSGASVEDVVAESGMDADRVDRFAAPVLAEREHVALNALGSSVRRRGESSGHRSLRAVVAERLQGQGVDADDVGWDAWKRNDAHWQVSADYDLAGEPRHAEFRFDPQGRFSLADDDDARWLAGERPSPLAASVDRDDELALIRATQDPADDDQAGEVDDEIDLETLDTSDAAADVAGEAVEALLQAVPPAELSVEELGELVADDPESEESTDSDPADDSEPTRVAPRDEAAEPTIAVVRHLTSVTVKLDATDGGEETPSPLDTLYDMLGGDGYAEDSPRVYAGLTDAAAVPAVDEHEFEPAADVLVPAEPDVDTPVEAEDETEGSDRTDPADDEPEPLIPSPGATRKPGRRKRASVPSWDEIMFGGPKRG